MYIEQALYEDGCFRLIVFLFFKKQLKSKTRNKDKLHIKMISNIPLNEILSKLNEPIGSLKSEGNNGFRKSLVIDPNRKSRLNKQRKALEFLKANKKDDKNVLKIPNKKIKKIIRKYCPSYKKRLVMKEEINRIAGKKESAKNFFL